MTELAEHNSSISHSIDTLIIGQGICGSFLSWYLKGKGKSFLVIDNNERNSPSRIAAGVINPVTGRRHVTVWMAGQILPFSLNAYHALGHELGKTLITQKNIIDFFPSAQMRLSFLQRMEEENSYLHAFPEQNQFNHLFNYEFGCGEVRPAYSVHLDILLADWREKLRQENLLREEEFHLEDLKIGQEGISYQQIIARNIIFCDGINSSRNPYFEALPFAPNKGEALIVEIEELPSNLIYKKGMMLVPISTDGLYWWGSDYQWEFNEAGPTESFRQNSEWLLRQWLKIPFRVVDHLAGIRPATLERRPFIGMHPHHPRIGILNGMGTKGCSLAPFFASQLADHLAEGTSILPEADISRFSKLLSRKT